MLQLRFYDGLSHDEIAVRLGISPGNARVRLCRALNAAKASPGFTLFAPLEGEGALYLIDLQGKVAHSWKMPYPPVSGISAPNPPATAGEAPVCNDESQEWNGTTGRRISNPAIITTTSSRPLPAM